MDLQILLAKPCMDYLYNVIIIIIRCIYISNCIKKIIIIDKSLKNIYLWNVW